MNLKKDLDAVLTPSIDPLEERRPMATENATRCLTLGDDARPADETSLRLLSSVL